MYIIRVILTLARYNVVSGRVQVAISNTAAHIQRTLYESYRGVKEQRASSGRLRNSAHAPTLHQQEEEEEMRCSNNHRPLNNKA